MLVKESNASHPFSMLTLHNQPSTTTKFSASSNHLASAHPPDIAAAWRPSERFPINCAAPIFRSRTHLSNPRAASNPTVRTLLFGRGALRRTVRGIHNPFKPPFVHYSLLRGALLETTGLRVVSRFWLATTRPAIPRPGLL